MADVISFSCNFCGTLYRVPFAQAGRSVQCKQCKHDISVPTSSQAIAPGPLETSVDMNAGDVVMRKETSARNAPVARTSGRATRVISGRTLTVHAGTPVAPKPPMPVIAPPPQKSMAPVLIGVAVVVVLALIVALVIIFGTKDTSGPSHVAKNSNATEKTKTESVALSEADKIRRELEDPSLTSEKALELYRRAQSAKFTKAELGDLARRFLNKLYDENGGRYSGAQVLGMVDEFAGYELQAEVLRLVRLLVAREHENAPDGKPSEVFLRMQKMLGREKVDFEALARRTNALIEVELSGAVDLQKKISELAKANATGWVEAQDASKVRELVSALEKLEKAFKDLQRDNPTLLADRAAFKRFKGERAAKNLQWTYVSAGPFLFYVQLRESEKEDEKDGEAGARDRIEVIRADAVRLSEAFMADWVKPLDLKRSLPAADKPEAREAKKFEVVISRDNNALVAYARAIGEGDVTPGTIAFYSVKVQRVGVSAEELGGAQQLVTELNFALNMGQMFFNHYSVDPLVRDEDQRSRGIFHSMLLDRSLLRCILTPVRANSRLYLLPSATSEQRSLADCGFFEDIRGLNELLARWRKPFARAADGQGIDSFGGPAVSVRNLIEMTSDEQGQELMRANFAKLPGIGEDMAKSLSEGNNYRLLLTSYGDALLLFLYHFERQGKAVYRDGLIKFIEKDLKGMKRADTLKGFEEAMGLNDAKWKQLEEDFAASQK